MEYEWDLELIGWEISLQLVPALIDSKDVDLFGLRTQEQNLEGLRGLMDGNGGWDDDGVVIVVVMEMGWGGDGEDGGWGVDGQLLYFVGGELFYQSLSLGAELA